MLAACNTLGIRRRKLEPEPLKLRLRSAPHGSRAPVELSKTSNLPATSQEPAETMSLAAAGVLRRAALNAFRLNSFRAPVRTLSAGPKKPAAELTFKEAWLSDPATYPIVVIISSP